MFFSLCMSVVYVLFTLADKVVRSMANSCKIHDFPRKTKDFPGISCQTLEKNNNKVINFP